MAEFEYQLTQPVKLSVQGGMIEAAITDPPSFANPPNVNEFLAVMDRHVDSHVDRELCMRLVKAWTIVKGGGQAVLELNPLREIAMRCVPDGPDRVTFYHLLKWFKQFSKHVNG